VLQDGPTNFAFVPEEGFAAGTIYKLCVQSGVADLAGNTMREEYLQWFSPQVVALRVAAIHIAGDAAISDFGDGYCYGFTPQIPDESALVALEFSSPIVDAAQRQRTVARHEVVDLPRGVGEVCIGPSSRPNVETALDGVEVRQWRAGQCAGLRLERGELRMQPSTPRWVLRG